MPSLSPSICSHPNGESAKKIVSVHSAGLAHMHEPRSVNRISQELSLQCHCVRALDGYGNFGVTQQSAQKVSMH